MKNKIILLLMSGILIGVTVVLTKQGRELNFNKDMNHNSLLIFLIKFMQVRERLNVSIAISLQRKDVMPEFLQRKSV